MFSHGDTPICQNLVCLCQRAKTSCQTQTHGKNIILILRSKAKIIQSKCMYTPHRTMVIHSCAKQSMTMSKDKKSWGLNTKSCHKPNKFNLEVRDVVSGSWMYLSHPLMVIDPCAKYIISKSTDGVQNFYVLLVSSSKSLYCISFMHVPVHKKRPINIFYNVQCTNV